MVALSLRARRILAATATAGLLAVPAAVVLAPQAQATPPQACNTLGGFEIDGDMVNGTSNCTDGGLDWDNVGPTVTTIFTSMHSTNDQAATDPVTDWSFSGTPAQDSLMNAAYAHSYVVTNGAMSTFYADVAWHRVNGGGTSGFILELDNAADIPGAAGTPVPDRSNGGDVLYLTAAGNGAVTLTQACSFTGVADYPGTCSAPPNQVVPAYLATANAAVSTVNPLTSSISPMATNTFVEVSLNLTALAGLVPGCPSTSFAVMHIRSYTGNFNLQQMGGGLTVQPPTTCVAPAISTRATPGNSTIDGLSVVTPGTAQHDTVTVGTAQAPGVGSVKFYLCRPNEVTAGSGCVTGGTLVSTDALVAGQTSSGTVDGTTTPNDNAAGTYCWRAEFTPSADGHNYLAATHTNDDTECFTVAAATPSISTQITVTTQQDAASGSLGLTTVSDTATVTGVYPGADLTGQTVTFSLYGPFASAPDATSCSGTPVATRTGSLTKVDDTTWRAATAVPTDTVSPTAAGYYTWVAAYAGDTINASATDSCGQPDETTHIVGAAVTVEKDASAATISAGDRASFDLKVQNQGSGTATGVVVTDPLPVLAGGNIWQLATPNGNPDNCGIGADPNRSGAQLVTCTIGTLNPTAQVIVATVSAVTTPADCGTISNTAYLATTNDGGSGSSTRAVTVQCAALELTKVGDSSGTVGTGQQVGFTMTATNSGQGVARNAVLTDPLPKNAGLDWTVDSASPGSNCAITGTAGDQRLTCALGDLQPGATAQVHIVSGTTEASCGNIDNTAFLTARNTDGVQASAEQGVSCPVVITPTPSQSVSATPPPLSHTGAGPIGAEIGWGVGLFGVGLLLALAGSRRRYRRAH